MQVPLARTLIRATEALVTMPAENRSHRTFADIHTNDIESLMPILKCHLEQGKSVTITVKPTDQSYRAFVVENGPEPELPSV